MWPFQGSEELSPHNSEITFATYLDDIKGRYIYLPNWFRYSFGMALDIIPEHSAARSAAEDLVAALAAFQAIDDANPATAVARKVMLKQAVNAGVRLFHVYTLRGTFNSTFLG